MHHAIIYFLNLDDIAVTKAGHDNLEFNSGKIFLMVNFLIFSIKSNLSFSIKKTGFLCIDVILLANEIKL